MKQLLAFICCLKRHYLVLIFKINLHLEWFLWSLRTSKQMPTSLKLSGSSCSRSGGLSVPLWMLRSIVAASEHPVTTDRSCSKENQGRLYYSFSSSALFFSSSGSNGNSSSWSSLGLEGDLYEDNLSFPTSDRLVQSRNLKTDESFTTNAWCHILKTMWVTANMYQAAFLVYVDMIPLDKLHLMKKIQLC